MITWCQPWVVAPFRIIDLKSLMDATRNSSIFAVARNCATDFKDPQTHTHTHTKRERRERRERSDEKRERRGIEYNECNNNFKIGEHQKGLKARVLLHASAPPLVKIHKTRDTRRTHVTGTDGETSNTRHKRHTMQACNGHRWREARRYIERGSTVYRGCAPASLATIAELSCTLPTAAF